MMRTIEILLVIIIITSAFIISSFFAVLPQPRSVSPINLRRLALTTLQTLDSDHDLSTTVFMPPNDPLWNSLEIALSACLPPNIVFNLTVYQVQTNTTGSALYQPLKTISNVENLGASSDASSSLVASSNVTFNVIPEKVGEHGGGGTLYILNCSDANSWWITGYTAQKLAEDLYSLLSPYFQTTIMIQNTTQLERILNQTTIQNETLQSAVVINTFGEAVPIPAGYYSSVNVGYDADQNSYARYFHTLGLRVHAYNWTWASIVGYPFYYVGNTVSLSSSQNGFGIYGMSQVGPSGVQAFLQGLNSLPYDYNSTGLVDTGQKTVQLTSYALANCTNYGIYPFPNQTATRSLYTSTISTFNLTVPTYIFNNSSSNSNAGAVYRQASSGALLAIGVTRTPDIRLTALGLLSYFNPRLFPMEHNVTDTSRLVVLQLGQVGGA
jgi:hypothetical protein